jgi:hypothetical protein
MTAEIVYRYDVQCGPVVVTDGRGLSDVIESKLYQHGAAAYRHIDAPE